MHVLKSLGLIFYSRHQGSCADILMSKAGKEAETHDNACLDVRIGYAESA